MEEKIMMMMGRRRQDEDFLNKLYQLTNISISHLPPLVSQSATPAAVAAAVEESDGGGEEGEEGGVGGEQDRCIAI